jgi:hypothetical protein
MQSGPLRISVAALIASVSNQFRVRQSSEGLSSLVLAAKKVAAANTTTMTGTTKNGEVMSIDQALSR